jgi:hypothetical protein
MKFTFTNKETYLAYRSNWKSQYKELSTNIRNAKFCCWFTTLSNPERITPELEKRYASLSKWHGSTRYGIMKDKTKATAMLEELKEAKQEAQRQYLAEKEAKQELIAA